MKNTIPWTSLGTARSKFIAQTPDLKDKTIRHKQLSEPVQSVIRICELFGLTEEYFYQAYEFVAWGGKSLTEKQKASLIAFMLLFHKSLISGNICLPCVDRKGEFNLSHLFEENGLASQEAKQHSSVCKKLLDTNKLSWLIGSAKDFKPFVIWQKRLYHQKSYVHEQSFINSIKKRLSILPDVPPSSQIEQVLKDILETHPIYLSDGIPLQLSEEQQLALLIALHSSVTIISGGPGTGKTSIVVTLLRLLSQLGGANQIALAAPTGRAAKRMAESIEKGLHALRDQKEPLDQSLLNKVSEAQTLHRLLGYSPSTKKFKFHENNPLGYDLIVVDEASMIDIELMAKLFNAITPTLPQLTPPARLVLLGDADQLPSVGAGAVLMNLVPTQPTLSIELQNKLKIMVPHLSSLIETYSHDSKTLLTDHIARLTRSYRQREDDPEGRNILGVASQVNLMKREAKEFEELFDSERTDECISLIKTLNAFDFKKVSYLEQQNNFDQMVELIEFWVQHFFSNSTWKSMIYRTYFLDQLHKNDAPFKAVLDYYKQCRVLPSMRVSQVGANKLNEFFQRKLSRSDTPFYPGAPVMVQKNDYENNLFNGDEGVCLWFHNQRTSKKELQVVFPDATGYRVFYPYQLHHLQLSYAITIHKSQGSEYDHVAILLPAESNALLLKEMLYTAITRAKQSVLLLGPKDILEETLSRQVQRYSGINFEL